MHFAATESQGTFHMDRKKYRGIADMPRFLPTHPYHSGVMLHTDTILSARASTCSLIGHASGFWDILMHVLIYQQSLCQKNLQY
jgi:hypothetical protein